MFHLWFGLFILLFKTSLVCLFLLIPHDSPPLGWEVWVGKLTCSLRVRMCSPTQQTEAEQEKMAVYDFLDPRFVSSPEELAPSAARTPVPSSFIVTNISPAKEQIRERTPLHCNEGFFKKKITMKVTPVGFMLAQIPRKHRGGMFPVPPHSWGKGS